MDFEEYRRFDALGLADLIASGQVSSAEVLEAAIARSQARNGLINAVVAHDLERARSQALNPATSGPLAGVPFLVKDLVYMQGMACTYGSRLYKDNVVDHDSTAVERFRNAGLNIFARTNTPEFGLNVVTEPALFGPTRNPWNTDHTPGGSSGGAGAAVADGWVPAAHATDGGGSIRIPAACCGLVGLKPGRARNPSGPDVGEGWSGMSAGHVVSWSVRDSAAFLDVLNGPAPGDPYSAPHHEGSYLDAIETPPRQLRIGIETRTVTGVAADPECLAAVDQAAILCEGLGHIVEVASPEFDRAEFGAATSTLVAANIANQVFGRAAALGRALRDDDVEPHTRLFAERGRVLTAEDYARSLGVIHRTGRVLAAYHADYDLMLSPVLVCPPVRIGYLDSHTDYEPTRYAERFLSFWGYTNLQNATGQPAISLPLHRSIKGLPIGVQFVSATGGEALLLRLARQLEQAAAWPRQGVA
ncbi:MAG: amidase family protein [Proteobacteria bacterium]|nr:amidase family protein [Pseudomonadota bacterium]